MSYAVGLGVVEAGMVVRIAMVVLVGGCAAPSTDEALHDPDPTPSTVTTGSTTATDTTSPTGTGTTGTTSSTDADVAAVEALLAGDASVDDVLDEVAWGGGWPVIDEDGTAWFVLADDAGPWALAGDFNAWEPEAMTAGDGFWYASVAVSEPAGQGYKFVSGDTWIADPWARSYTHDEFGELSYVDAPTDTWRLDRWPELAAEGLAPRDVRVYVPAGDGPWPVLYAHDGQNLFDPAAIWGGWRLQDSLAGLDPMLVVGVDNTVDRMDEYTHVPDDLGYGYGILGGEGDAYAALVHDHLRPHVEQVYGSTGHDGVMGSSLGGLISLHVAQANPGAYDFVASLSGTLGWGRFGMSEPTMEERWLAQPPADIAVYVDSGGSAGPDGLCLDPDGDGFPEDDPDSSDNYCESRQFADALAAGGWSWDADLWHWHEPGAPHSEIAWADRVWRPLELFLQAQ